MKNLACGAVTVIQSVGLQSPRDGTATAAPSVPHAGVKLWLRSFLIRARFTLRKRSLMALRALLWHADEWLHRKEIALRNDLAAGVQASPRHRSPVARPLPTGETFLQWEARKSGIAVISKKEARRRRGMAAREFDLRFAR